LRVEQRFSVAANAGVSALRVWRFSVAAIAGVSALRVLQRFSVASMAALQRCG
jgi:hypothetical protein